VSNRIEQCFQTLQAQSRKALIPFITAGDPDPDWTVGIMHELVAAGADVIELGVPFSDPMADGPVIQESSERAIRRGVTLACVLQYVQSFRRQDRQTPVVLMGYVNPVERYGYDAFSSDAARCGVDGVLLVDCPVEEAGGLESALARSGIHMIRLLAPTTAMARMAAIAQQASGYLYYVSFAGITGADLLQQDGLAAAVQEIRRHSTVPVAVGFGIKGPQAAAEVARCADAVIIGSALVQRLAQADSEAAATQAARAFLAPVRTAMDNIAKRGGALEEG
jgi:tryptophan synthase alpha chain